MDGVRRPTPQVVEEVEFSSRVHPAATASAASKAAPDFPRIGDFENEIEEVKPKISCCYGIGVFVGLATALLVLTGLVIYAGFWYNLQMIGK